MKQTIITLGIIFISSYAAFAQIHVENAIKDVAIVTAPGVTCEKGTASKAIINNNSCRTITVRVEESSAIDKDQQKKTLVFSHIKPNENRFIGCSGCLESLVGSRCLDYKIVLAYYDDSYLPGAASLTSK